MTRNTLLLTISVIAFVLLFAGGFLLVNNNSNNVQTASKCIVTILGDKYDVTTLQTTHSGGNVFICGTDMTSQYEIEHGSNLRRIQPYKIS